MRQLLATCALCLAACGGATPDPGADLLMRVRGAQLVRAPLPTPEGGPPVTFVDVRAPRVSPGEGAVRVGGRTAGGAHGLYLATDREEAYWILPTGVFDSESPGELSWETLLDFSRELAPGPFSLLVQATGEDGRPGPVSSAPYEAMPLYPEGALVVTLEWDADVDADLFVVDPKGVTLGGKNLNTWSPAGPGQPLEPPTAYLSGGMIDLDSNSNCVIDGRRRESAVWKSFAPSGRYLVQVGLAGTCGHTSARFTVTVRRAGAVVTTAFGALYESDARGYPLEPAKAAGVLATEFDF